MAKKRAVITPWENICSTAPLTPMLFIVPRPMRTKPMWETEE